jgi:hypothetical protein
MWRAGRIGVLAGRDRRGTGGREDDTACVNVLTLPKLTGLWSRARGGIKARSGGGDDEALRPEMNKMLLGGDAEVCHGPENLLFRRVEIVPYLRSIAVYRDHCM